MTQKIFLTALGALALLVTSVASANPVEDALKARAAAMTADQQSALLDFIGGGGGEAPAKEAAAPTPPPARAEPEVSPNEAIIAQLKALEKAMNDGDAEAIIAMHSEDFEHPQVGGKEEMAAYVEQGVSMGYLEDVEMYLDDIEFEKDGEDIIAYPIDLESPMGAVTLEWVFRNEDGTWRIVTGDASGI